LDLTTDAEYVANLAKKCQCVIVNVQQCSLLRGHNDIFLSDIIAYDRLKVR